MVDRRVPADERNFEGQLIEAIPAAEVTQGDAVGQGTKGRREGLAQPGHRRPRRTEIDVAPGRLALERVADRRWEVGRIEVEPLEDAVHHRAHQCAARHVGQAERNCSRSFGQERGGHLVEHRQEQGPLRRR